MIKSLKLMIASCVILSNCAANFSNVSEPQKSGKSYTILQLQENPELYNNILQRNVLLEKINDELVYGLFCELRRDSVVYVENNTDSKRLIANNQVKYISLIESNSSIDARRVLEIAAVISGFVFIIISLNEFGDAY